MSAAYPIGEHEGVKLEFKQAAVRPEAVAREVAAMLNTMGGEIWIGIEEEGGVAVGAQGVTDPGRLREAVRDTLLGTIEPTPRAPGEIEIQERTVAGKTVLVVVVKVSRGSQRPYAWMKGSARAFDVRQDDRLQTMTREQLAKEFNPSRESIERENAASKLVGRRREWIRGETGGLWVGLQPMSLEIDKERVRQDERSLLQDPQTTGNRPAGWNFASEYNQLRPGKQRLTFGDRDSYTRMEIHDDGCMLFFAPEDRLHWKGPEDALWAFALLEYPVSLFRLARKLLAPPYASRAPAEIVCELGIVNARRWRLSRGSPLAYWSVQAPQAYPDTEPDDLVVDGIGIAWEDLERNPDAAAIRLVDRVYEIYGFFPAESLPPEFDRTSRRLVLPP